MSKISFSEQVLEIVSKIQPGKVLTYQQVAKLSGNKNASRAVGTLMRKNQDKKIPCHRVVRSDGCIGEYNNLQGKSKMKILISEGVLFSKNGKVILN